MARIDAASRRLRIGKGYVENVSPEMWAYEVSGKQVLNVLGRLIMLEPAQADLLERICAGARLSAEKLVKAGALAGAEEIGDK